MKVGIFTYTTGNGPGEQLKMFEAEINDFLKKVRVKHIKQSATDSTLSNSVLWITIWYEDAEETAAESDIERARRGH